MAAISKDGNMYIDLDEVYAYTADMLSQYSGITPQMRREEYRRMKELFDACDADSNGKVTLPELTAELNRQLSWKDWLELAKVAVRYMRLKTAKSGLSALYKIIECYNNYNVQIRKIKRVIYSKLKQPIFIFYNKNYILGQFAIYNSL